MPTNLYQQVECAERLPECSTVVLTDCGKLRFESRSQTFYTADGLIGCKVPDVQFWLEECTPGVDWPESSPDPLAIKAKPDDEVKDFKLSEQLSESILRFMADQHPHTVLIATPTNVQLLEGICSTGEVHKYLKD